MWVLAVRSRLWLLWAHGPNTLLLLPTTLVPSIPCSSCPEQPGRCSGRRRHSPPHRPAEPGSASPGLEVEMWVLAMGSRLWLLLRPWHGQHRGSTGRGHAVLEHSP